MVSQYYTSFFCNRPRQRRRLANWLAQWSSLFDDLQKVESDPTLQVCLPEYSSSTFNCSKDQQIQRDVSRISIAVLKLRLSAACQVVVSGFELDLYNQDETPFMRWYAIELFRAIAENAQSMQLWKTSISAGEKG